MMKEEKLAYIASILFLIMPSIVLLSKPPFNAVASLAIHSLVPINST